MHILYSLFNIIALRAAHRNIYQRRELAYEFRSHQVRTHQTRTKQTQVEMGHVPSASV